MVPKPYADYRANIRRITLLTCRLVTCSRKWDNIVNTSGNGWLTKSGSSGLSITIDMQQTVKLSRILHHSYAVNQPYDQVNITEMEIW